MQERWKPIPVEGLSHYWVSREGHIRDEHGRKVQRQVSRRPVRVVLIDMNGKKQRVNVARIVLTTFLGPSSQGRDRICYLDGDRGNCNYANIAWASKEQMLAIGIERHKERHEATQ